MSVQVDDEVTGIRRRGPRGPGAGLGRSHESPSADLGKLREVGAKAAMAGVLGGETAEDFGEAALELLESAAALSGPGGGAFEFGLRLSVTSVVGGGTNDIQRGLIARGLGLPR